MQIKKEINAPIIVLAPSLNPFSVDSKEYYHDKIFSVDGINSFLKKKLSSLSVKINNFNESTPLGEYLTSFKYFIRDNDSFQDKVISGLYPLIKDLVKPVSSVLDVGPGSNYSIMNFFKRNGFLVSSLDALCFPPGRDRLSRCESCSNREFSKLCNGQAPGGVVHFLGSINGIDTYIGSIVDFKKDSKDLIYFWGSWSSDSNNYTLCYKSMDFINDPNFVNVNDDYSARIADAEFSVKTRAMRNCYSILSDGGALMIVNPCFARHGDGYYYLKNSIIDYIDLLNYLSDAGFKEVFVAGYSGKGLSSEVEKLMRRPIADFKAENMYINLFKEDSVVLPYIVIAKK